MPKINVERIPISDRESLSKALMLLTGTPPGPNYKAPLKFVAPCRLSSIHLPVVWPQMHGVYQIIVGDDAETLGEFWNGAFCKTIWTDPYASQLWLPTELANEPILHEALRNWLRIFTGTGSSNAKQVEFLSSSISSAQLEVLRRSICNGGPWVHHSSVPQANILQSRKKKDGEEIVTAFREPSKGSDSHILTCGLMPYSKIRKGQGISQHKRGPTGPTRKAVTGDAIAPGFAAGS